MAAYFKFCKAASDLGLPIVGVNQKYVDTKLKVWSSQINQLTKTDFKLTPNTVEIKEVKTWRQVRLIIGAWQESGLVIEVSERGSATWETLQKDVHYTVCYPEFDTYIDAEKVNPPVIAINFQYLTNLTRINRIKITGTKGWCNGLPDELFGDLQDAMLILLGTQQASNAQSGVMQVGTVGQLSSESDNTNSRSWKYADNQLKSSALLSSGGFGAVEEYFFDMFKYSQSLTEDTLAI